MLLKNNVGQHSILEQECLCVCVLFCRPFVFNAQDSSQTLQLDLSLVLPVVRHVRNDSLHLLALARDKLSGGKNSWFETRIAEHR